MLKGFIEVTDAEDSDSVLVNVNSIVYVFSETISGTESNHAVIFLGPKDDRLLCIECCESYQTVRMMIEHALIDRG